MKKWVCFIAVMTVASCSSATRVAVMQNKETKQTAECRVDPWGHINVNLQVESCIKSYEQAGFVKLSDSHP
jgi:hypothetical protein